MPRIRVSTTVDEELLRKARELEVGRSDAALLDASLAALLNLHRAADLDATYAAYDEQPLDEPDEWGDLSSFRTAASAT